ncbi:MAG: glycosyltransferase family 9 protein, partial [Flavobacteriales bacterium]
MQRILVIQTAFIGDAILGTSLLEKLHQEHPKAKIDYLVRKGNQSLFDEHPYLNEVLVWNKKQAKYSELVSVLKLVRSKNYDAVFNIQRYAASGILTAFSGAKMKVGYKDNPLSFLFSKSVKHRFGNGFESVHEVDRVLDLVGEKSKRCLPRLFPTETDLNSVSEYKEKPFVTIAPASVWFTKQFPIEKWVEFVNEIPDALNVLIIGAKSDQAIASEIQKHSTREVTDLTGKLKLLQTAALMKDAVMNYANDSAPVHLASAVNAPITEMFCSTIPEFGFTP